VLGLLDLFARQAADIIERVRGEHALKDSEAAVPRADRLSARRRCIA